MNGIRQLLGLKIDDGAM